MVKNKINDKLNVNKHYINKYVIVAMIHIRILNDMMIWHLEVIKSFFLNPFVKQN